MKDFFKKYEEFKEQTKTNTITITEEKYTEVVGNAFARNKMVNDNFELMVTFGMIFADVACELFHKDKEKVDDAEKESEEK